MEYGIQLQIESVDDDALETKSEVVVNNWLQDNNPLLQNMPESALTPTLHHNAVVRVSELRFVPNDDGFSVMDGTDEVRLKTGDVVMFQNMRITVLITKLYSAPARMPTIDLGESLLPQDYFHENTEVPDDIGGYGLLNSAFSPPSYIENKPADEVSVISTERPLDSIDQLFDEYYQTPFEKNVALHHQTPFLQNAPTHSIKRIKQFIWGEE